MVGHGVAQGARTAGHGIAKAGTSFWEFAGGKAGLLGPSDAQRDDAMAKAQRGDYSQFATLRKEDAQALLDEKSRPFAPAINPVCSRCARARAGDPGGTMPMPAKTGGDGLRAGQGNGARKNI